jgi:hypothetical protein
MCIAGYETFNETADVDEAVAGQQSGHQSIQRVSTAIKRLRDVGQKLNSYYTNVCNINSVDDSVAAGLFIDVFSLGSFAGNENPEVVKLINTIKLVFLVSTTVGHDGANLRTTRNYSVQFANVVVIYFVLGAKNPVRLACSLCWVICD